MRMQIIVYSTGAVAPKPPSDEGGGSPNGETEGEKTLLISLPQSKIKDFLTSPSSEGAKG